MACTLNTKYLENFISQEDYFHIAPKLLDAHNKLHLKSGLGNEFTGWINLPENYDKFEFEKIKKAAKVIRENTDVFIVIGIGGSYLGSRAVIELLKSPNYNFFNNNRPKIFFIGNSISTIEIETLLKICKNKDVSINVISKSGTTIEPAIAFRIFRKFLEKKYGKERSKKRIFCTTDKKKGILKKLATEEGYETFVIPDDIGGRYSVLTPVGLLPIAVAGIDIDLIMQGALKAQIDFQCPDPQKNDCYKYAVIRNILYGKGKLIEILIGHEPRFALFNEWFKQLFGESEGKDLKGIFPSSLIFSTDLHSMGQFIQEGSKIFFETIINVNKSNSELVIENEPRDIDSLNFLNGKTISYVNQKAFEGALLAHTEGNVPNIVIEIEKICEEEIGYLIYFFEKACAISGYLLNVNPFDQPGVENYKRNMFALLDKPGYESHKKFLLEIFK